MALLVPRGLPAASLLRAERLTVDEKDVLAIAPGEKNAVRIAILNLMPTKEATETQLLRVLGSGNRLVDVTFLRTQTHTSQNTAQEHLDAFYTTLSQARDLPYDGLVVTGAPVEMLEFEEVDYWPELVDVMEWAEKHVRSTYYICWAAQAALWHFYGVRKYPLSAKCFGIFEHRLVQTSHPLVRSLPETFPAPHSRHTEVRAEEIQAAPGLVLLAASDIAGVYLAASEDARHVFATGHSEYDADTLKREYDRDVSRNLPIDVPYHYYPDDDPSLPPPLTWRAHSVQIYQSWIENCLCR